MTLYMYINYDYSKFRYNHFMQSKVLEYITKEGSVFQPCETLTNEIHFGFYQSTSPTANGGKLDFSNVIRNSVIVPIK